MRERKSHRAIAAGAAIALLAGGFWASARPGREAAWRGCLGKRLEACPVPRGFTKPEAPCPDYFECETTPPGVRYAVSRDLEAPRTFWASTAYAAIALDAQGRVVAVEAKRRYAAF